MSSAVNHRFFYTIVDVNSNNLVLAVSTYIQNDWFLCCAKIYSRLGDIFIFPLMEILGIDSRGSCVGKSERNWAGLRSFFERKLPELKQIRDDAMVANNGQSRLYGAVIDEVVDTLERQLSEMAYLQNYETRATVVDEAKMKFAPVTNLGCDAECAKLDIRIVASGRSTYSRKNIIMTNRLLLDLSFTMLSDTEKRQQWKWTRCSDNVLKVKEIESKYLPTVKMSKRLALMKKAKLKKKKQARTLKLLETRKCHQGHGYTQFC